jgi:hypothetical protein
MTHADADDLVPTDAMDAILRDLSDLDKARFLAMLALGARCTGMGSPQFNAACDKLAILEHEPRP